MIHYGGLPTPARLSSTHSGRTRRRSFSRIVRLDRLGVVLDVGVTVPAARAVFLDGI